MQADQFNPKIESIAGTRSKDKTTETNQPKPFRNSVFIVQTGHKHE
jgi:hypothetical protein